MSEEIIDPKGQEPAVAAPRMTNTMDSQGSFNRGLSIAIGLNLVMFIVTLVLVFVTRFGIYLFGGFGLTQGLWLGPFIFRYRKEKQPESIKGMLTGAGITLLLNAACWQAVGWPSLKP